MLELLGVALALQMGQPTVDSAALLRTARAAQARFENIRRANLPRLAGDPGHPCHANIGRFCSWSDRSDTLPPPESPKIAAARAELLARLDSVIAMLPGDPWAYGQRTRYLLEAGKATQAAELAAICAAERWWCAALGGLALHVAERYHAADSAFTIALDSMPASVRCRWTDLSDVLDRRLARELGKSSCEERERIAGRLWLLAKPVWWIPGNDMKSEHLARETMARIQYAAASTYSLRFGEDNHEMMVRYGWSEWYTLSDPGLRSLASPAFLLVTGHGREPSFSFFPAVSSLRNLRVAEGSWRHVDSLARSRYAPRYLKEISALPHQLIRQRRGDTSVIVVAFRLADTVLARDESRGTALFALHGSTVLEQNRPVAFDRGELVALLLPVPRDTVVASIEILGDTSRRLSRARYTVDPLPCERVCLSDLLLFEPATAADTSLEIALTKALTEPRHRGSRQLAVYWELYAAPAGDAEFALTMRPVNVGRLRRLATRMRLAPERSPVSLRWRAEPGSPTDARSVVLRFPETARGDYRVVLTITTADGRTLRAEREIELTR